MRLAKKNVHSFLKAWEITQPYWQDENNDISLLSEALLHQCSGLLFSILYTLKEGRLDDLQTCQYWSQCLAALFEDKNLSDQAKQALLSEQHAISLLRSAYITSNNFYKVDFVPPLFSNKSVFKHLKEDEIMHFLRHYGANKARLTALLQAIYDLDDKSDKEKKARLTLTAILTGHALRIKQEWEKKHTISDLTVSLPSLHTLLLEPINYRIDIQEEDEERSFSQNSILVCIQTIYEMEEIKENNKVAFDMTTLSTFFANLINGSHNKKQIAMLLRIMRDHIEDYDDKEKKLIVTQVLAKVDFLSLAYASPDDRIHIFSFLVAFSQDFKLTDEQCRTCFARPPPKEARRLNGECFLDMMGMRCNSIDSLERPYENLEHIILEILKPLKSSGDPALIHALLKESDALCALLPQPHHKRDLCLQQCAAFGHLLQYQINLLKKKNIKTITASIGERFLIKLKSKIDATALNDTEKRIIWQQYLHCMDEQLSQLETVDKADLIQQLYADMPAFAQGKKEYQTILEKYRCCIRLKGTLQQDPHRKNLEQVFKQAAKGTLYDICHVLTAYWRPLCALGEQKQTQWLRCLLGASKDTPLPQRLSELMRQSSNETLKSQLLDLLFQVEKKEEAGSSLNEEEKENPPSQPHPTYLNTQTIEALLNGQYNIYMRPTADFNAVWQSTQPWLHQQNAEKQIQILGKDLLQQWLSCVWDHQHEEQNDTHAHGVFTCMLSPKQNKAVLQTLVQSALQKLKSIFCDINGIDHPYRLARRLALLTHLLPLVTARDTNDKTCPKWLATDFLAAWIKQSVLSAKYHRKIYFSPVSQSWEKLITTMARVCPWLLLSQLEVGVIGLIFKERNTHHGFFQPIITTLLQLSQQKSNTNNVPKKAHALLIKPDVMGYLYHTLFQEAVRKEQYTAIWQAFIQAVPPAACLFETTVIRLTHYDSCDRFHNGDSVDSAADNLITVLFNKQFFASENSTEKAACFLTNLIQLMPKDHADRVDEIMVTMGLLHFCLNKQLKKIGETALALPLINALIRQLEQKNYAHYASAANEWKRNHEHIPIKAAVVNTLVSTPPISDKNEPNGSDLTVSTDKKMP